MNRAEMLVRVREHEKIWDLVIIGGGATGLGCAVDAASRGYEVLLVEQSDFAKGTSSRSTKLVHGGVRYLAQGNLTLVREALGERAVLSNNAPHLVRRQEFVVPVYSYWDKFFYGTGLKTYNLLSGKNNFGKSRILSKRETGERLPNVKRENLEGGVLYYDGQFDDARLAVSLAETAVRAGAVLLNYARVFAFHSGDDGRIEGAAVSDEITGQIFLAKARVVVNATGAFCDHVRQMSDRKAKKLIAPSQGVHLVCDGKFLPSESALMIPKTSDERVLFAIPWYDHAVFGTTDTPVEKAELEPKALEEEIDFILQTAASYLERPPRREDVLSVFVGVRPLVRTENAKNAKNAKNPKNTAALARDHTIEVDEANLVTVTGGKWTTYRLMAEETIDRAAALAGLPAKKSDTKNLKIHGYCEKAAGRPELGVYGADAREIEELIAADPALGAKLHEELPYLRAQVVWAVRREMAETVEDVLARRLRALFLNARAALAAAPEVAEIMSRENGRDEHWVREQLQSFAQTAESYLPDPTEAKTAARG